MLDHFRQEFFPFSCLTFCEIALVDTEQSSPTFNCFCYNFLFAYGHCLASIVKETKGKSWHIFIDFPHLRHIKWKFFCHTFQNCVTRDEKMWSVFEVWLKVTVEMVIMIEGIFNTMGKLRNTPTFINPSLPRRNEIKVIRVAKHLWHKIKFNI